MRRLLTPHPICQAASAAFSAAAPAGVDLEGLVRQPRSSQYWADDAVDLAEDLLT